MAQLVSSNGTKVTLESAGIRETFIFNKEHIPYIRNNQDRIYFDSTNSSWRYMTKKGTFTTLPKHMYIRFKRGGTYEELTKKVRFANGDTRDLRTKNLTIKR